MINVPTVDKYCENIEDNFNIFALDFVTSIIFDGKIKDGSEKFVVRFKDTLIKKWFNAETFNATGNNGGFKIHPIEIEKSYD